MNDSFLNSANAPYVAELFIKFKEDPNSIDHSWNNFFKTLNEDDLSIISGNKGTAESKIKALEKSNVLIAPSPAKLGETMLKAMQKSYT